MGKVIVTFVIDENKDLKSCLVKGGWMDESESIEIVREDNVKELTDIRDELLVKAIISDIEKHLRECD